MPNERTVSKGYCIVLVFYTSMISLRNLKDFTILSEIKFIFFNCLMKIYRYTKGCLNLFYSFYFSKGFLFVFFAFHFGGCSFDFFKKEERTYGKL